MPLILNAPGVTSQPPPPDTATTEIALLNNLGDAGLERGERQIIDLLAETSGSRLVRLRFFSLPSLVRGKQARARMSGRYTPFADLMQSRVDGLIVTGCEPRARFLPEEAFWSGLTEVIDWAEHNTRSTIWSCLAAHAAVLHLDGIARQPLQEKCTGVFNVERACEHPLTMEARGPLHVPHSRWNGLIEDDLVGSGYRVLTRSPVAGVDSFIKRWRSLFVYLQGHPEYDSEALGREYRRDVARFLAAEARTYPTMPRDYYNPDTEALLRAFLDDAQRAQRPALADALPTLPGTVHRPWRRGFATALFRNWLTYLQTASEAHVT